MMEWLLLLLILLVALLFVPITLRWEVHPTTGFSLKRVTFGGLEIPIDEREPTSGPPPSERPQKNEKGRQGSKPLPTRKVWAILKTDGFMSSLGRFFGRLLAHLRPRQSDVVVVVGLEDPASTGCLWGTLAPLTFLLFMHPEWGIAVEPDFTRSCFEAEGHATIRLIPGVLLGLVLAYVLSPTVLRATARGIRA